MSRPILIAAALAAGFLLAWLVLTGPAPRGADAPADAFSAGRAMADVSAIAQVPHPVGSAADAAAREHVIARMTALGLSPRVQSSVQISDKTHKPVQVQTVIGLLPGRDPKAPALAVMAHYDSVARGPGAADDASGTAAALEIARALKAGGPTSRDVAFVITDGEEAGMLGAKAFFASDPLARRLGFVVNLEARGSRGRAMMFETGRGNGQTVRLFASTARRPVSNSLMVMVYDLMPNFTDFTEAKNAGLQGVNFAFLGGPADYHQPTDTAANFDRRSLQDIGQQALAITGAAARGPLPQKAPNLVYSDLLGLGLAAYPPLAGWLVIVGGAVLLAAGAAGAETSSAGGVGIGIIWSLAFLIVGVSLMFGVQALSAAMRLSASGRTTAAEALGWAVSGALLVVWLIWSRGSTGRRLGFLLTGLVLAAAAQAAAAPAAPVLAWPVLLACAAASVSGLGRRLGWLAALLAVPGLAFAISLSHLAFLSLLTPLPLGLWPWLSALLLAPLIGRQRPR
jgi:hypothetical protein